MGEAAATSFPKDQIKVLLLENVAKTALEIFDAEGFQVEALKTRIAALEAKAGGSTNGAAAPKRSPKPKASPGA